MKKILLIILSFVVLSLAEEYTINSPDRDIVVAVDISEFIQYSVRKQGSEILSPSRIDIKINKENLGINPKLVKHKKTNIEINIQPVVKEKQAIITDNYNQLTLEFSKQWQLLFRVYNDGVAYRIETEYPDSITVDSEVIEYNFDQDYKIYFPEEESMYTHQEREYKHIKISEIGDRFSSIPALIDMENGTRVLITESDLYDYPGFYLTGQKKSPMGLKAIFPHYPLATKQTSDRDVKVTQYASYLAKTSGTRKLPWRLMIISNQDKELIESQLVYKLARPNAITNPDWIKPGKVAWDWWNALNIYGVDFKSGINTKTYKYYIDFAAQHDLDYIILDEGWSDTRDLFDINPNLDLQKVLDYGEQKNIGIILWMVWSTLDKQLNAAMDQFEEWGVRGIKVDFMQRDDQEMVNYYWNVAEKAAKHKLLVNYHGCYKPAGLRRTYPNVITREGVKGLEQSKWSQDANPDMAVTLPFIRMVAGPMDYTPGAMNNANQQNFRAINSRPMSQGTRCHQLAMYVVYESPLQMLADNPSNYYREPECMDFLSSVPTTWDQTKVLAGKVGEYVIIARKSGDKWYIGAMTDWTPRDLKIKLNFLDNGEYNIDLYKDGVNADRCAIDFVREKKKVTAGQILNIQLAPGGGWAAIIHK